MEDNVKEIIEILTNLNKTISTMESCTGGGVANAITNVSGASEVIKFSAVTYSNEFKIKLGVNADTIEKYSVYSKEVSLEMSKCISVFANSDYGIGITGKLNRLDKKNLYGKDNQIFISIYDKSNDIYYSYDIFVNQDTREKNKKIVIDFIIDKLLEILK